MSSQEQCISLAVVGSVAIDTIETPSERREEILGGSASYACATASFFGRPGMVGIVGSDFPPECISLYKDFGIDLEGLQTAEGATFRWSGVYEADMNNRSTLSTDLNVFADFRPEIPDSYKQCPYLLLGNISPDLQLCVLDQVEKPRFTAADTMDLWINSAKDDLLKVIERVDMLMLNDSEARLLTGEHNVLRAANEILKLGPAYVIVKKGEHGGMLCSEEGIFIVPAYPVATVSDPTGAGDSFAGGFMGSIVKADDTSMAAMRRAMLHGSVLASFGVERFSLERLAELTWPEVEARLADFTRMITP